MLQGLTALGLESGRLAVRGAEPTIIHWQGLGADTCNDDNESFLVPPAGRYDYDFTVRDRSGMAA